MKKLIALLIIGFVAGIMSCDNQNADTVPVDQDGNSRLRAFAANNGDSTTMDSWTEIAAAGLPQAATDYLAEHYASAELEEVWQTNNNNYVVLLDNEVVIFFDSNGGFLESLLLSVFDCDYEDEFEDWEEVELSAVSQTILDYASTNYASDTVTEAYTNSETGEILLVTESDLGLLFDASGNFVEEIDFDEYDDYDDEWDEDDDFEAVAVSDLPQAITDYLNTNHAGDSIAGAEFSTTFNEYLVFLESDIALLFDADGNFIESFTEDDDWEDDAVEVDPANLPQAILDHIATNYAGANIEEAWYNEEDGEYYVIMDTDICLVYDKDGNFIGEEELDDDDDGEDDDDGDDDDDDDGE